jgi:hypothetical protein
MKAIKFELGYKAKGSHSSTLQEFDTWDKAESAASKLNLEGVDLDDGIHITNMLYEDGEIVGPATLVTAKIKDGKIVDWF